MTSHLWRLVAHAFVAALVLLLLTLKLGSGLVLGLVLYSIGRKVYLYTASKTQSSWMRAGVSIMALLGSLVSITWAASYLVRYTIRLAEKQHEVFFSYGVKVLEDLHQSLPRFLSKTWSPDTQMVQQLVDYVVMWLKQNWIDMGSSSLLMIMQLFFAVLFAVSCCAKPTPLVPTEPLRAGLHEALIRYTHAFYILLRAQFYIACWNACCTALFIYIALPLVGTELPFREALLLFTWTVSLIPAVGNVLANTALALLCIPHGLGVTVGALVYSVLVHKAEYLINARILGKQVNAGIAEMLLSILLGERLFGMPGLILGPVTYVYAKAFLRDLRFV